MNGRCIRLGVGITGGEEAAQGQEEYGHVSIPESATVLESAIVSDRPRGRRGADQNVRNADGTGRGTDRSEGIV